MHSKFSLFARFENMDGAPFSTNFRVAPSLEGVRHPPKKTEEPPPENDAVQEEKNVFSALTKEFTALIQKFNSTMRIAIPLLGASKGMHLDLKIKKFCEKNGEIVEKEDNHIIFGLHQTSYGELSRHIEELESLSAGVEIVPEFIILGLVSAYDAFFAELIRAIFNTRPEMLSASERTLSYAELSSMGSIQAAKDYIIEKEVETVIRQSHADHFDWLEKKLKIPLRKDLNVWSSFIELCERRNLLTHTGGLVSSQYLSVCKQHGVDTGSISVGDKLKVDMRYAKKALGIIEELGIKLIQVSWRKLLPSETEEASYSLNDVGYTLIVNRRYKMANTLLEFGLSLNNTGPDRVRRMMLINNANAHKLAGRPAKAREILDGQDWSAAGDQFQICIAAIKDDVDGVCDLIASVDAAGKVGKGHLREWPVFEGVRSNEKFLAKFEAHYGEPLLVTQTSSQAPAAQEEAERMTD
ncbi:hypothetical protein [Methylosinus sp. Ce-a6]|uniref:hypothetical protein n=1 Tax=Methylosinus sp. Ce-a6 TaxID=2172005 RepID=UPI00135B8B0C|nr:hypothetical protein [Methylosinus sp. Ce-a6]